MNCPHGGVDDRLCLLCNVAGLRAYLAKVGDGEFADFLNGYAYGTVAGELLKQLGAAGRIGFFRQMMHTYDLVTGEIRIDGDGGPAGAAPAAGGDDSRPKNVIPIKTRS